MDADAQLLQLVNDRQAVHDITGETSDGLRQDMIDLPRPGVLDHLEHAFSM